MALLFLPPVLGRYPCLPQVDEWHERGPPNKGPRFAVKTKESTSSDLSVGALCMRTVVLSRQESVLSSRGEKHGIES